MQKLKFNNFYYKQKIINLLHKFSLIYKITPLSTRQKVVKKKRVLCWSIIIISLWWWWLDDLATLKAMLSIQKKAAR